MDTQITFDVLALAVWVFAIGVFVGLRYANSFVNQLSFIALRFIVLALAGGFISVTSLLLYDSQIMRGLLGLGLAIFGLFCIIMAGIGWLTSNHLRRRANHKMGDSRK